MRKIIFALCSILVLSSSLSAQKNKTIVVKAGRNVKDYFPVEERYLLPEFSTGKAVFRNGIFSEARFNLNLLQNDMEFIKNRDTLAIINKKDILYIEVAERTFYFDNGYIEIIAEGPIKVGLKKYYKLAEMQKLDSYGTSSPGGSRENYNSFASEGNFYKLTATFDMTFRLNMDYYLSSQPGEFVSFRKNNVLKLFPGNEAEIKSYLKTNKIDFDSESDLIKLAGYLGMLKSSEN